jgi:hypothetical protein
MQNLSEALAWLEQNETSLWCAGYFDTAGEEDSFLKQDGDRLVTAN